MVSVSMPPNDLSLDMLWRHVEETWEKANAAFVVRFCPHGQWISTCYDVEMVGVYRKHYKALVAYAKFERRNPADSPHFLAVRQLFRKGSWTDGSCRNMTGFPLLPLRSNFYDVFQAD
jgi:hypothetical protein